MPRSSMKDVAARAGVSQSTVSRVLNNVQTAIPIADSTLERVLRAAGELGYVPNPLARGLRGGRTRIIGLIVREIADPFFAQLIEAITGLVKLRDYNIMLGHARGSSDDALALTDILDTRHCDGLLLLGDVPDFDGLVARILESGSKAVAYCSGEALEGIAVVDVDNVTGTELALDHLTALGHRRIGFLAGGAIGATRQRLDAYRAYMQRRGLEVWPTDLACAERNDPGCGYRAMRELLARPEPPTAVFASDDAVAIGALKAAFDARVRIPSDLSLVGFDDIDAARYTIPALTTVRQPLETLAQEGVDLLFGLVDGTPAVAQVPLTYVQPELIVRDSTAEPSSPGAPFGRRR